MNAISDAIGQNHIRSMCEGIDCNEQSSTQIIVHVGKLGIIPLNLCTECSKLFRAKKNKNRKFPAESKRRPKITPNQTTLEELH